MTAPSPNPGHQSAPGNTALPSAVRDPDFPHTTPGIRPLQYSEGHRAPPPVKPGKLPARLPAQLVRHDRQPAFQYSPARALQDQPADHPKDMASTMQSPRRRPPSSAG